MSLADILKNFLALILGTTTVLYPNTTRNAITTTTLTELTSNHVSSLENATTIFVSLPSHHPDWTNQTVNTRNIDSTTYTGSTETEKIDNGTITTIGESDQTNTDRTELTTYGNSETPEGESTSDKVSTTETTGETEEVTFNNSTTSEGTPISSDTVTQNSTDGTNSTISSSTVTQNATDENSTSTTSSNTVTETVTHEDINSTTASSNVTSESVPSNYTSFTTENHTTTTSAPKKSGLSGGQIAGIVVGVLLVVAVLAGVAIFFIRKRSISEDRRPLTA